MLLRYSDCQNAQFGCAVLLLSLMDVVSAVPPSLLYQFGKLHLLLPKPLDVVRYHTGDFAPHPAAFIIFAHLSLLCVFIILIFPILHIVGACKSAQTISDSNHYFMQCFFGLSGGQPHVFSCCRIFLLLSNCCLCVFNLLCCPSNFSPNLILDQIPLPSIA